MGKGVTGSVGGAGLGEAKIIAQAQAEKAQATGPEHFAASQAITEALRRAQDTQHDESPWPDPPRAGRNTTRAEVYRSLEQSRRARRFRRPAQRGTEARISTRTPLISLIPSATPPRIHLTRG